MSSPTSSSRRFRVAEDIDTKLAMGLEAISMHATGFPAAILKSPSDVRQYYATRAPIMNTFDDLLVFARDGKLIADTPSCQPARRSTRATAVSSSR